MRVLLLALLLFASPAVADEAILGTTGNESRVWGDGVFRVLTNSTFQADLQAAGTYTYASASDCLDMVSSINIVDAVDCNGGGHQIRRTPKDTTFTRLVLVLATDIDSTSAFACKARLFLDGTAYADSEVVLAGEMSAGETVTASFSHRVSAGSRWAIQFANADGCSNGSSCSCGESSGGETLFPYVFGVEH